MIPPPVPHIPTTSKRKTAKKPKKVIITSAGLPPVDMSVRRRDSTPHTFKKAKKWSENNGIQDIFQPAQFPDLNPIEFLWEYFKCQLYQYEIPLERVHELWNQVSEE